MKKEFYHFVLLHPQFCSWDAVLHQIQFQPTQILQKKNLPDLL